MEDQSDKFIDILLRTIERGGNLIIPSFAVGRTQEILYEINKYAAKEGYAEKLKIYRFMLTALLLLMQQKYLKKIQNIMMKKL